MARVWFTASTMSAASLHPIASISVFRGKSILLSASLEFLTDYRKFALVVLSCADPRPTVSVFILLLTVCHIYTSVSGTPAAATVMKLRAVRTV